ncbi:MAG: hypothetical protein MUO76_07270 [Anaerolineaceae bacterium]|nr:hypothetical protein [Anaerolineaceae bacterium]
MPNIKTETIKNILGQIPFTAELYWLVRQRGQPIHSRFSLKNLGEHLPEITSQVRLLRESADPGRNVFIFATLHYWIEHAALVGLALAAKGHNVTLGFIPYADWQSPINLFDLRRQNAYAQNILKLAAPFVEAVSFLNTRPVYKPILESLSKIVDLVTLFDTQYTLQNEEVDPASEIYKLRLERNGSVARVAYNWLKLNQPDVVIVPNGMIQELGVVYRIARSLNIPSVTYEFGDQRKRIWLAQNAEVMRQETDDLWNARREKPLTDEQLKQVRSLFAARQGAALWKNFARRWQDTPAQGGAKARAALGLDKRPVVLLATNVLGDSLSLGRQVFSDGMTEWISRTVQYFIGRPDVQLVIRVHPGEVLTHGLCMEEVIYNVAPKLPEHIKVIGPKEKFNTYDVVAVADMGLVYTTTVGLEMALQGLPVIVAGQTHYRGCGFTFDPDSWVKYYKMIGGALQEPELYRLTPAQVELPGNMRTAFSLNFRAPFPGIWCVYGKIIRTVT